MTKFLFGKSISPVGMIFGIVTARAIHDGHWWVAGVSGVVGFFILAAGRAALSQKDEGR